MNKLELNRDNPAAAIRIQYVAYARLQRSDLNVRRKAPTGLEAVAETILQKGILQNNRNLSSCYTTITASTRSAGSHISRHEGLY
ncbi:hypothetical protein R69746_07334 [Paraburkholderia aspalathi]|uniref:hypothetical protein n=1 Tax=Paraburkholderia aspalathi TaxID=1324617 RepID=UPI00190C3323|nr:hypothetical protein [Paraburkholderia aspalathi]MBK3843315.1 hypothetical protein [Paraburkholderia aspalathi]CAE6850600.1 hypothetical protein R69746_07334 [Paraburkholderia aspalathi]CAE6871698.1 hypothetical protein R75465_08321 [Paraburkholderia aspalathi]